MASVPDLRISENDPSNNLCPLLHLDESNHVISLQELPGAGQRDANQIVTMVNACPDDTGFRVLIDPEDPHASQVAGNLISAIAGGDPDPDFSSFLMWGSHTQTWTKDFQEESNRWLEELRLRGKVARSARECIGFIIEYLPETHQLQASSDGSFLSLIFKGLHRESHLLPGLLSQLDRDWGIHSVLISQMADGALQVMIRIPMFRDVSPDRRGIQCVLSVTATSPARTGRFGIRLHGVRGSRPTHKSHMILYGGNSTCAQFIIDQDFYLFIDGGSGLAAAGRSMGSSPKHKRFFFLMTHTHWDHILGFPFFNPFYNADNHFTFFASNTSQSSFKELFFGLRQENNLPVPIDALKATVAFNQVKPNETFEIEGKIKVSCYQLNHQGITLGYRVSYDDATCCFITDNAPIDEGNYLGEGMEEAAGGDKKAFEEKFNDGLAEFLRNADTVIFDTHFTPENLKPDWGHSTPEQALEFCIKAKVKKLILFHHAPEDTDEDISKKVTNLLQQAKEAGIEVEAAQEGKEWKIKSA